MVDIKKHNENNNNNENEIKISKEFKELIEKEIEIIEKNNNVQVLLASELGSKTWGWASSSSDSDIRFIYSPKLSWYLSVETGKKTKPKVIDHIPKFEKKLNAEFHGWELNKALKLLRESNPGMIECVLAPIIYKSKPEFFSKVLQLVKKNSSAKALAQFQLSVAKKHWELYIKDKDQVEYKKYFYVIRPLFTLFVLQKRKKEARTEPPPLRFQTLIEEIQIDEINRKPIEKIKSLLEEKMNQTLPFKGPFIPLLNEFIIEMIKKGEEIAKSIPFIKDPPTEEYDTLFYETVVLSSVAEIKNLIK